MTRILRPLCATCQTNRVKSKGCRYCSPHCVPREIRAANGRRSRQRQAFAKRRLFFRRDLDRIVGKRLTRGDLLALFQDIYKRGYNAGFQVGKRNTERAAPALAAARDREAA